MKKYLKKMLTYLGLLILIIIIIAAIFINTSPQFGGKPSEEKLLEYKKSDNYGEDTFVNLEPVNMSMSFSDFGKAMLGYFKTDPNTRPLKNIEVLKIDSTDVANYVDSTRMIWFGHSTFLLQMEGKKILIDPMFGNVPAPHPTLGGKRFSKELPIEIEQLPRLDLVILSHDHYDHLDYESIIKLKDKVDMFYVPLGLSAHLLKWDVPEEKIVEFDWWDALRVDELQFVCAPAKHFSGRGLTDRMHTLWASWIVKSKKENIFFSGDSGYGKHFVEIGEKYGPFDFAMLECGQYNEKWPDIHMMPEETAQAAVDLGAKTMMPIHWGAFKLAVHPWTEPVERLRKKGETLGIDIKLPKIGEEIVVGEHEVEIVDWWGK